jgi:site-specific DNA-methyltransferase (adenine-specific)
MRIALDTDRVSLLHGDSLEALRSFADKSFDVTLSDPPYNKHVHDKLGKERRNDGTTARAELTFPPMTPDLLDAVMKEIVRVSRSWIIIFTDFFNTHLWGEAAQRRGGAWVRTGQWVKTSPMPQLTGDRPATGSEDIIICHANADSRTWEWNAKGKPATWRGRRDEAWPSREEGHPNQKPLWLLQSLLGMFVPPGGLVLDPYIGSATLAAAALATERFAGESTLETTCPKCAQKILEQYQPPLPQNVSVVGVEGDQKWVDLAIRRIHEAAPSLLVA